LRSGATRKEVVAQRAGLSERGTQVLLDGLVGLALVDVIDGNYRNSPEASEFLVEGKPAYMGGYVKFTFADMGRWAGMPEAVRMGAPLATDTADVTSRRTSGVGAPAGFERPSVRADQAEWASSSTVGVQRAPRSATPASSA
jgi:hypothetical protein